MTIDVNSFYTPERFARFKAFAETKDTPFVVIDTDIIDEAYTELTKGFPVADIFYAIKANPAPEILTLLRDRGSNFDVASRYELDKLFAIGGISPDQVSYGNTIKKAKDVRYFYEKGVRMFATDSEADLRNIAKAAPGSRVYVRILTEGTVTADWPLSRKFGCRPDMAMDLLVLAKELGLIPYGISFHVGSQQRDIGAWDAAIASVKVIFERLKEEDGIILEMINMGGGFPANYIARTNDLATYAEEITRFLEEDFGTDLPRIILEPGRSLISNAGVLVSEVVLISRKSHTALNRWIFTDVGKFSGLIETLDESIKYPIHVEKGGELEEVIIAGPTCDSADIMYENYKYGLPLN
ncbi:MAG: type III PLP-dependent enzyme, partial [Gammaproteobacteria bacterium]|nr:type III PLP-dependent enzyme [Gammaproteobacteria bacterium]